VELIVIDELGYVPLAEVAAELLFQVIAERAEKAAIIVTTTPEVAQCTAVRLKTCSGRLLSQMSGGSFAIPVHWCLHVDICLRLPAGSEGRGAM